MYTLLNNKRKLYVESNLHMTEFHGVTLYTINELKDFYDKDVVVVVKRNRGHVNICFAEADPVSSFASFKEVMRWVA